MNDKVCNSKDNTSCMVRTLAKRMDGLKICHLNAQSVVRKIDELRFIFQDSEIDVICISETWFVTSMPDSLFKIDG